jgi:hypothetical protein
LHELIERCIRPDGGDANIRRRVEGDRKVENPKLAPTTRAL